MLARAAAVAISRSGARTTVPVASAIRGRAFSTITRTSPVSANHVFSGVVTAAGVIGAVGTYTYLQAKQHPVLAETKPLAGIKGQNSERTFIAVKPDGVQRGLVGKVVSRFEERGYKLVAIKAIVPSRALAEEHYADLRPRPFFKGLVDYMTNGNAPVVAMVWEGKDVIRQGRAMIGATNPLEAAPGSIRGQYCVSIGRNIIHGSDSYESAVKEIGLWFGKPGEVIDWQPANWVWTMADN